MSEDLGYGRSLRVRRSTSAATGEAGSTLLEPNGLAQAANIAAAPKTAKRATWAKSKRGAFILNPVLCDDASGRKSAPALRWHEDRHERGKNRPEEGRREEAQGPRPEAASA